MRSKKRMNDYDYKNYENLDESSYRYHDSNYDLDLNTKSDEKSFIYRSNETYYVERLHYL